MSAIESARLAPQYGATELRVYHFEGEGQATGADTSVWMELASEGMAASGALTAAQAREVATGLTRAADAIEAQTLKRGY